jgi:phosphoadenosine phosphosulfate reductase
LHRRDPDQCCFMNKVLPLRRALQGVRAWISGVRRDQTPSRADTPVVGRENGRVKIAPMARWTERDVWRYLHDHDLPEHPLLAQGYLSVGCAPCTRPVAQGEDARAGRWPASAKSECGIHLPGAAPPPGEDPS